MGGSVARWVAEFEARLLATAVFQSRARIFKMFMEPRNRFQGTNSASLCSLASWYDNPFPPGFLAPIDSLKIPTLTSIKNTKWAT
jgi:hypothetical protein